MANHWVRLLTAALLALYATCLVSGEMALMEEMFRILAPSTPAIRLAKIFVTLKMPIQFRSNTADTAWEDRLNSVFSWLPGASREPKSACSPVVQAEAGAPPAPLIRM